jgi:hypothetical protein
MILSKIKKMINDNNRRAIYHLINRGEEKSEKEE